MATAAAEEPEVAEEPKESPIVLIIGGVVGLIVLIVGIVLGTLFFTGYFNPKPVVDEHAEASADAHGDGHGDKKGDGKPSKKAKDSPELTRFLNTPTCKLNASSWSTSVAPKKSCRFKLRS
jgi:hypothetical protein